MERDVECLINSRPLGYPSNNPNDLQPLTPNHVILGQETASVPQGPYRETRNLCKCYEFVQLLVNHFWKIKDVVLLMDSSWRKWEIGRISKTFPG